MGKAKFVVVKSKEVIKTAIFALLGVLMIIALIYLLVPKGQSSAYESGTYTSAIDLGGESVNVEVSVDSNEIKSVSLVYTSETVPVFFPLFDTVAEEIEKAVIDEQSVNVKLPDGAEYTGSVILGAVEECLEQAKKW